MKGVILLASRRCINIDFYNSDSFLDLQHSAITLYTFLILYSDDYGVVANPKTVMRLCGASDEDISSLFKNGYLIEFESGKIAIKHWLIHNQIQPDKRTISQNVDELKQLLVIEDKREYILSSDEKAEKGRINSAVTPLQYKTSKVNEKESNSTENNSNTNYKNNNSSFSNKNERELSKGKQSDDYSKEIQELNQIRKSRGII